MFLEYIQNLHRVLQETVVDKNGVFMDADQGLREYISQLIAAHDRGNHIFFIGNGGSAGICTHSANDYSKNGGMRSLALHDGAVLTCLGNDFGFEFIFSKQIEFHAREGDILIAISSSGRSADILRGVEAAKAKGMYVCTFSGFSNENPLRKTGDLNWYVSSGEYGFVEMAHQIIIHCALDRKDALSRNNIVKI